MANELPLSKSQNGVYVAVWLSPKARQNRIEGMIPNAGGNLALKASVTAAAEDGKANAALIRLLAKEWRLAKGKITIVRGKKSRRKLLHLASAPDALATQLAAWLKPHDG